MGRKIRPTALAKLFLSPDGMMLSPFFKYEVGRYETHFGRHSLLAPTHWKKANPYSTADFFGKNSSHPRTPNMGI
jgi:hypothetical protein